MIKKVPIYRLTKDQRTWMNEVYSLLRQGIKIDFREIHSRLDGQIANTFMPEAMSHRLVVARGEVIRLLGVVALQKSYDVLDQCNNIILAIRKIIMANPKIENIDVKTISEKSGIDLPDTGILLNLISEYGRFWRGATYTENNFQIKSIQVSGEDWIFYEYKRFKNIQGLIIHALEGEKNNRQQMSQENASPEIATGNDVLLVDKIRIAELRSIDSKEFDFTKLIKLCEEINDNFTRKNYLAVGMIGRTILNHIPPVFNKKSFDEVANNYGGPADNKSFKGNMANLNHSLKHIADSFLHLQIRKKEALPTEAQINFRQDLDVLLGEIARLSK